MQVINAIFFIAILIMSVVIHEVAHGFVAEKYGDKTARYAGRLTLNPLKHLDLFGSIFLPILLYLSTQFVFGWAKPVPYNPNNLSNRKWGTFWVAFAGILANLIIAVFFGILIRLSPYFTSSPDFLNITNHIILINLSLAVFNLMPIPPLDGSKIFFTLLPYSLQSIADFLERYSLILLVLFILFVSKYLYLGVIFLYYVIVLLHF